MTLLLLHLSLLPLALALLRFLTSTCSHSLCLLLCLPTLLPHSMATTRLLRLRSLSSRLMRRRRRPLVPHVTGEGRGCDGGVTARGFNHVTWHTTRGITAATTARGRSGCRGGETRWGCTSGTTVPVWRLGQARGCCEHAMPERLSIHAGRGWGQTERATRLRRRAPCATL